MFGFNWLVQLNKAELKGYEKASSKVDEMDKKLLSMSVSFSERINVLTSALGNSLTFYDTSFKKFQQDMMASLKNSMVEVENFYRETYDKKLCLKQKELDKALSECEESRQKLKDAEEYWCRSTEDLVTIIDSLIKESDYQRLHQDEVLKHVAVLNDMRGRFESIKSVLNSHIRVVGKVPLDQRNVDTILRIVNTPKN